MNEGKHSFFTTVPGILTGIAAVITAVGAIYLGVINSNNNVKLPPSQPKVTPITPPKPDSISQSYSFSMIGLKRLGGRDCEMDTDPQDTVTVNFTSELTHTSKDVVLSVTYDAEEYKGNHTKVGDQRRQVIFQAPSGKTIVELQHRGSSIVSIAGYGAQGRNHGYRSFGSLTNNTYWDSLTYKVDDQGSNDCAAAGVTGSLRYKVLLLPRN